MLVINLSNAELIHCQVIEALKSGTAALKGAHSGITIDAVEDVMDEVNEVSGFLQDKYKKTSYCMCELWLCALSWRGSLCDLMSPRSRLAGALCS